MLARVRSAWLHGIEAIVLVEVGVTPGLPTFTTDGLPDSTVGEHRDRGHRPYDISMLSNANSSVSMTMPPSTARKGE
jgi:predicted ATPase with chaperone activity